jgi:uncharacterized protein (UPF0333 family)
MSKKAILSLEYLIHLILSVLALFLILFYFASLLFNPTNKDIVESNSNSIIEFLEYSNEKFDKYESCYTLLKMRNVENFQIPTKNNEDNYVYTIGIDNGNLALWHHKEEIFTNEFNNGDFLRLESGRPYATLDKNIQLKVDKTSEGAFINLFGLLNADLELDLDEDVEYIFFKPVYGFLNGPFENKNLYNFFYKRESSDQIYKLDGDSSSIVYNPVEKELFVSKSEYTDTLIKRHLCSFKLFLDNVLSSYYADNPEEIDHPWNRIFFYFESETGDQIFPIRFKWDGEAVCYSGEENLDCNNIFNLESDEEIYYRRFVDLIYDFFKDEELGDNFDNGILRVTYEEIDEKHVLENIHKLSFEDVFQEGENFNLLSDEEKKNRNLYRLSIRNPNELNECDKKECFLVESKDNFLFFYVDVEEEELRYFKFKENFLRKKLVDGKISEIYFLKTNSDDLNIFSEERGNLEIFSMDDINRNPIFSWMDNEDFYLLRDLDLDGKKYDVVLSQFQLESELVRELK